MKNQSTSDFSALYIRACAAHGVQALPIILNHADKNLLIISFDRMRYSDWTPLFEALRDDRSLLYVAIRSTISSSKQQDQIRKFAGKETHDKRNAATIQRNLSKALRSNLRNTHALTHLEIVDQPLSVIEIRHLCEGLTKNCTLRHLSFEGSTIGDSGLLDLCRALRNASELIALNVSHCRISHHGVSGLVDLIKFQAMQRQSAAWHETLRYRHPVFDNLGGLRRITLNDNPGIGDLGSNLLATVLIDDLWIKAIDLQGCDLTDIAATAWLQVLVGSDGKSVDENSIRHRKLGNQSLVVLDVRRNPKMSRELLRTVTERVLINSEGKHIEYNWLTTQPSNETFKPCITADKWPGLAGFPTSKERKTQCLRVNTITNQPPEGRMRSTVGRSYSARPTSRPAQSRGENKSPRRRSQSLTPKKESCRMSLRSGDHSNAESGRPKAVWKPPGRAQPIQSSTSSVHRHRPTRNYNGDGIPWRSSLRATKCCRSDTNAHCPKQNLQSYSIPHEKRQAQTSHYSHYEKLNPRERTPFWERGRSLRSVTNSKSRHTYENSFKQTASNQTHVDRRKQDEMQAQMKKLMIRVAHLENELRKERNKNKQRDERPFHKPNVRKLEEQSHPSKANQSRHPSGNGNWNFIDPTMIKPLGELVQQLQALVEQTGLGVAENRIASPPSYLKKLAETQKPSSKSHAAQASGRQCSLKHDSQDTTKAVSTITSTKVERMERECEPEELRTRTPMETIEQNSTLGQQALWVTHTSEKTLMDQATSRMIPSPEELAVSPAGDAKSRRDSEDPSTLRVTSTPKQTNVTSQSEKEPPTHAISGNRTNAKITPSNGTRCAPWNSEDEEDAEVITDDEQNINVWSETSNKKSCTNNNQIVSTAGGESEAKLNEPPRDWSIQTNDFINELLCEYSSEIDLESGDYLEVDDFETDISTTVNNCE